MRAPHGAGMAEMLYGWLNDNSTLNLDGIVSMAA